MKLFSFPEWSLRARVSALVAIPLVCITLLTLYNINAAINRETANLQSRGEKLLLLAADASELALFAGDVASLNNLGAAIMRDSQIAEVLFFDENKQKISSGSATSGFALPEREFLDGNNYSDANHWYFIQSVRPSDDIFDDDPERYIGSPHAELLGWVILAVDLGESRAYQALALRNNLLVALLMLTVSLWLAFRFSRAVVGPITNITLAVGRYGNEDFSRRVDEISTGELGALEKGINDLARRVGQSYLILKEDVEKATRDLEVKNIALADAKEQADAANLAKDDFLARMSHELRTPLTGIMGFTRLLANTEQVDLRQEYSNMIITSSQALLSTINDILDFSKLQANSFSLNPVRFNLEDCLRDAVDRHRVSSFDKAIELNVLIDSDIPIEIEADLDKLQKVVNNIVNNAVKFTPSGDILMFVSIVEQQTNEALISITIKDTGVGISRENIKHLFNPFYQGDESNTRHHDGTGLGLSIAEDFITLMGGSISVDSEEGEGTEVELIFRCRIIIDAADVHVALDSCRALLFDSNAWTRRSWRNQLLKLSNDVTALPTFVDLIESLKTDTDFDVLLLGLNFHDKLIEEAESSLKRIRAEYSGPIILAVADDGNTPFEGLCSQYKPLVVINKPLTNNRLFSALEKVDVGLAAEIYPATSLTPQQSRINSLTFNSTRDIAGLKILVAEDNKFNQTLLARLIEAAGGSVTLASDGLEAMLYCEKHRYDILLLDLHMPGLNGLQLSSAIRSTEGLINIATPIILLTADVLSGRESEILATGVNVISYKPIDEEDLFDKIRSLSSEPAIRGPMPESKRALINLSASQIAEEIGLQLQLIKQALDAQNLDLLEHQVHQLAGVAGLSGLDNIDRLVQSLKAAVRAGDIDKVSDCFGHLTRFWNDVSV